MSNPLTLPRYETAVKQMLIASYAHEFFGKLPPDEFVDSLNRIFKHKTKVIRNLALYVQKQVEEHDRPAEKVVQSLGFYAVILKEFLNRDGSQPIRR